MRLIEAAYNPTREVAMQTIDQNARYPFISNGASLSSKPTEDTLLVTSQTTFCVARVTMGNRQVLVMVDTGAQLPMLLGSKDFKAGPTDRQDKVSFGGDAINWTGIMAKADVKVDGFTVSGQQTFVVTDGFTLPPPTNGLLELADRDGGFVRNMWDRQMTAPVSSLAMPRFGKKGSLTFGGEVPQSQAARFDAWAAAPSKPGRSYYVDVDGWGMSEKGPLGSQLRSTRTPHVMIDSETNVEIVPPSVAEHYHSTYPGAEKRRSPNGFVTWAVPCDSKPRLGLRFGNRTTYGAWRLGFGDKRGSVLV
jgi:hypothetical protein